LQFSGDNSLELLFEHTEERKKQGDDKSQPVFFMVSFINRTPNEKGKSPLLEMPGRKKPENGQRLPADYLGSS